eukprot:PhM_4_TR17436/c0_g1_i1/m.25257
MRRFSLQQQNKLLWGYLSTLASSVATTTPNHLLQLNLTTTSYRTYASSLSSSEAVPRLKDIQSMERRAKELLRAAKLAKKNEAREKKKIVQIKTKRATQPALLYASEKIKKSPAGRGLAEIQRLRAEYKTLSDAEKAPYIKMYQQQKKAVESLKTHNRAPVKGYALYLKKTFSKVKIELETSLGRTAQWSEVSKELAAKWKTLSQEQKAKYMK